MADSPLGYEELVRLSRRLAESWARAKDDPLGSAARFAQGMLRSGGEQGAGIAGMTPVFGPLLKEAITQYVHSATNRPDESGSGSVMPGVDVPLEGSIGELIGIPTPSGPAAQARKLVSKIYDPNKVAAAEGLKRAGASADDIWRRVGAAEHEGQWWQDVGGTPKLKRPWNVGETQTTLGDILDWPEVFDALRRYGAADPEKISVIRNTGRNGYYVPQMDISGKPQARHLSIGDQDTLQVLAHELQHMVEHHQTGVPAGAGAGAFAERLAQMGNPRGLHSRQGIVDAFHAATTLQDKAEIRNIWDDAYDYYARNPGEQRAGVSEGWSMLDPSVRQNAIPFSTVKTPAGGERYTWDPKAVPTAAAGRNLVDGPAMPNAPAIGQGAQVDALAQFALRDGPLSPGGSHFATRGSSIYFDPGNPDLGQYNIGKVNVLNTADPKAALPVLRDVARTPEVRAMKTGEVPGNPYEWSGAKLLPQSEDPIPGKYFRDDLARAIREARKGEAPWVQYDLAEGVPLKDVAEKHGYGGYRVWENDDITHPSTVFIWDLLNVRPRGAVAKRERQKLEDLLKDYEPPPR